MEPKLTIGKSASLLKWLKAVLFQLRCAYKSPREIAKSDSVDLVWGLRVCVSNKLLGHTNYGLLWASVYARIV